MNRVMVVGGFTAAIIGAGVAAGTWTPVAYGAGEATASVNITGIIGTLTTLIGGVTGFWNLFRKTAEVVLPADGSAATILKRLEEMLPSILNKPQTVETITAEVALVGLFAINAKNNDMVNLAKTSELAASMLSKK